MHFIFPPDIITINITVIIIAMVTIITMITVQSPPDVISLGLCQPSFAQIIIYCLVEQTP